MNYSKKSYIILIKVQKIVHNMRNRYWQPNERYYNWKKKEKN